MDIPLKPKAYIDSALENLPKGRASTKDEVVTLLQALHDFLSHGHEWGEEDRLVDIRTVLCTMTRAILVGPKEGASSHLTALVIAWLKFSQNRDYLNAKGAPLELKGFREVVLKMHQPQNSGSEKPASAAHASRERSRLSPPGNRVLDATDSGAHIVQASQRGANWKGKGRESVRVASASGHESPLLQHAPYQGSPPAVDRSLAPKVGGGAEIGTMGPLPPLPPVRQPTMGETLVYSEGRADTARDGDRNEEDPVQAWGTGEDQPPPRRPRPRDGDDIDAVEGGDARAQPRKRRKKNVEEKGGTYEVPCNNCSDPGTPCCYTRRGNACDRCRVRRLRCNYSTGRRSNPSSAIPGATESPNLDHSGTPSRENAPREATAVGRSAAKRPPSNKGPRPNYAPTPSTAPVVEVAQPEALENQTSSVAQTKLSELPDSKSSSVRQPHSPNGAARLNEKQPASIGKEASTSGPTNNIRQSSPPGGAARLNGTQPASVEKEALTSGPVTLGPLQEAAPERRRGSRGREDERTASGDGHSGPSTNPSTIYALKTGKRIGVVHSVENQIGEYLVKQTRPGAVAMPRDAESSDTIGGADFGALKERISSLESDRADIRGQVRAVVREVRDYPQLRRSVHILDRWRGDFADWRTRMENSDRAPYQSDAGIARSSRIESLLKDIGNDSRRQQETVDRIHERLASIETRVAALTTFAQGATGEHLGIERHIDALTRAEEVRDHHHTQSLNSVGSRLANLETVTGRMVAVVEKMGAKQEVEEERTRRQLQTSNSIIASLVGLDASLKDVKQMQEALRRMFVGSAGDPSQANTGSVRATKGSVHAGLSAVSSGLLQEATPRWDSNSQLELHSHRRQNTHVGGSRIGNPSNPGRHSLGFQTGHHNQSSIGARNHQYQEQASSNHLVGQPPLPLPHMGGLMSDGLFGDWMDPTSIYTDNHAQFDPTMFQDMGPLQALNPQNQALPSEASYAAPGGQGGATAKDQGSLSESPRANDQQGDALHGTARPDQVSGDPRETLPEFPADTRPSEVDEQPNRSAPVIGSGTQPANTVHSINAHQGYSNSLASGGTSAPQTHANAEVRSGDVGREDPDEGVQSVRTVRFKDAAGTSDDVRPTPAAPRARERRQPVKNKGKGRDKATSISEAPRRNTRSNATTALSTTAVADSASVRASLDSGGSPVYDLGSPLSPLPSTSGSSSNTS